MEIVGGEETLREGFFNFQFEKEFIFKFTPIQKTKDDAKQGIRF